MSLFFFSRGADLVDRGADLVDRGADRCGAVPMTESGQKRGGVAHSIAIKEMGYQMR